MAGAFQVNAFQNNAFQTATVPPPPVPSGGGGGGNREALHAERKRRRRIEAELDQAIAKALRPHKVAEVADPVVAKAVGTVYTKPQRQTVFPAVWRELQVLSLLDTALDDIAARVQALVAQQLALHREQQHQAMVMAQDEEAAALLLDLIVRDLI
jgi:hypothetical protein